MANEIIIIQIMFIALGMVLFSSLFNKLFGLNLKDMRELQEKGLNLQERTRSAQALGDIQLMRDLQMESVTLMKSMMKKQFVPMCARCIVFLSIFAVIGIIYAPYDFWFMTYFLFSLLFSFSAMGIRYIYKKATHKEDTKVISRELMGILSPNQRSLGGMLQYSTPNQLNNNPDDDIPLEEPDSWKDRISQ